MKPVKSHRYLILELLNQTPTQSVSRLKIIHYVEANGYNWKGVLPLLNKLEYEGLILGNTEDQYRMLDMGISTFNLMRAHIPVKHHQWKNTNVCQRCGLIRKPGGPKWTYWYASKESEIYTCVPECII